MKFLKRITVIEWMMITTMPVALVVGPLLRIWSWNALAGSQIPYTFKTWLGALFLR